MTKLIPLSGKKFCKILEKLGFKKTYGKGSHIRFKHPDGKRKVRIQSTRQMGKIRQ